jgi:hypothetical protein
MTMTKRSVIAAAIALLVAVAGAVTAQQPPAPQPMSFFVTSAGPGDGANLGGLAGADKHCQALATAAGSKKTFRAYLSTQGDGAVNARDRIGKGPWFNAKGQRIAVDVGDLHGDTLDQARRGNNLTKVTALSEQGQTVNGVGDKPNQHDILTGSQLDGTAFPAGTDRTCRNWTSNADGIAMVGHHDRMGGGALSWNSIHPSKGCSQANLVATGGAGFFYCFAID